MRFRVVDRLRRPAGKIPRRALQKIFELSRSASASDVVAQTVSVTIIPRSPACLAQSARNVATETPWLGDEDHVMLYPLQLGLDLSQNLNPYQLRQVETESIDAEHLDQVSATIDDEALGHRGPRTIVVSAAAPVGKPSGVIDFKIVELVNQGETRGHSDVVVNDIHHDRHPPPMERRDELLKFPHTRGSRGITRIKTRRAEPIGRHVPPVILLWRLRIVLLDRLQLDTIHPEAVQIETRAFHPSQQPCKTTALAIRRDDGRARDEIPHMRFCDDEVMPYRRSEMPIASSDHSRVQNDAGAGARNCRPCIGIQDTLCRIKTGELILRSIDVVPVEPSVQGLI
ncbi:MAG: hypothetical protein BWX86_01570 [Verrucomicrobia bacterium ADurb.Bin122]|nr:MAG: hypothetical protein BWX86_01570 [Verrucomicrobia bacterium ADurb.Bin122]